MSSLCQLVFLFNSFSKIGYLSGLFGIANAAD